MHTSCKHLQVKHIDSMYCCKGSTLMVVMRCLLQITTICKEHGQLMADIWLGNAAMIEMIIERLRDFSFECRTR